MSAPPSQMPSTVCQPPPLPLTAMEPPKDKEDDEMTSTKTVRALPGTQEERTLRLRRRQTSPSAARPSSSSRPVTPEILLLALAAWRTCHRNPMARARAAADCVTDEKRTACEREAPHVRAPPRSVGKTSARWHGAGASSGPQTKKFLEKLS